jgi:hypothetical protein
LSSPLIPDSPLIDGNLEAVPVVRAAHPKEAVEASVYTPALYPREDTDTFTQMKSIRDEIALTGDSVEARAAMLNALETQNDEAIGALSDYVHSEGSTPEGILQAADATNRIATAPLDLATVFSKENSTIDLSETAVEQSAQTDTSEFFREIVSEEREMAKLGQFNPYARNDVASRGGYTLDGAAVMIPFNYQSGVRDIKESLGLESSVWDFVFFGSALDEVRTHLEAMPEDQRVNSMREIQVLLQDQGFTGTNEFIAHTLTQDILIDPHASSGQALVDNIIGVLDLVGVGQGLKGLFGGFKAGVSAAKTPTIASIEVPATTGLSIEASSAVLARVDHANPLRVASKTNPRVTTTDVAAIIADDTGQIAKEVSMTRTDAISEWILPKSHITESPITAQPGGVSDEILRIRQSLEGTRKDIDTNVRINYTEEELIGSGVAALSRMGKLFNSKTNVPSSVVNFTDTGIELSARFQANDVSGWTSVGNLSNHIETLFGKTSGQVKGLKVWKKHPTSGQWVDISKKMGLKQNQGKGEYSFTLDFRMDAEPAIKEAFGEDAISAGLGRATKYATSPHAMFDPAITSGATLAKDKSALLQHKSLTVMTDSFTKLRKSAPNDFSPVLDALRKGAVEEKWYGKSELQGRFGIRSKQGVETYETFKEVQDSLYQIASQIQYKTLKKEGYSSIYIDGAYSGLNVRAVEGGASTLIGKHIYVPSTERILKIKNVEQMNELIEDGVQFGTLKSPMRIADDEYQFVAIMGDEGAVADKLTHYPTPYREGHYTRFYSDGRYVVKVKNNPLRTVNGKAEAGGSEVVGIAKNRKEAETILEQIKLEDAAILEGRGLDVAEYGKTYEVLTGESWHTGKAASDTDWDMISKSMLNVNRRRGEWIRGIEDLASIEDPLEATAKQIGAVMDKATKQDWIETQRASWTRTFSDALYEKDAPSLIGTWPNSVNDLREQVSRVVSRDPKLSDLGDRAIAHYQYVEMVNGMPAKLDEWWRGWTMKMAEVSDVGTKQWHWLAEQKIQEEAKSTAFKVLIGLAPQKHLILQASQITQLSFVEPRYMFNFGKGGFAREWSDLTAYSSSRALGIDLKEQLPKAAEMWDEFSRTGLSEAVAHHIYLNPGDFSKKLTPGILEPTAASHTRRVAGTVVNAPQKVGFEAGERANVFMHWLVARRRWMDRNPGKDWKSDLARDQIHADQRAISLNPNPAGKMGYQDWGTTTGGIASLFLQFFSHSHKTLMSTLPRKVGGSRAFTPSEKVGIAAANLTFYGTASIPFFNTFLDDTAAAAEWEIDPEVWANIKHGLTDILINRLLTAVSGEEQDIRFSSTFSPTAGIENTIMNVYKAVMNEAEYKPNFFAAAGVSSSLYNTLGTINTVWKQPETLPEDKFMQSLERIVEIAPGWSNYMKGLTAYNTGLIKSKAGSVVAQATALESVAKMMGWTVGAEEDYYDHMEKLNEIVYRGSEKDIKDHAKTTLKQYMTIYKDSGEPINNTIMKLMTDATIMFKDMRQRKIFMNEVSRLTERALKEGTDNIITLGMKGSVTGDREELIEILNSSKGLPEETKNAFELMLDVRK